MRSETTTRRLLAVGLAVGTLALGIASLGASQQEARTSGEYPQVGADFLTALEREIGPHRGGRAPAVVGDLVFYFGASHGGVWKNRGALVGQHPNRFLGRRAISSHDPGRRPPLQHRSHHAELEGHA